MVVEGVFHPAHAKQDPARDQADGDEFGSQDPVGLIGGQQGRRHDQRGDEQDKGLGRARAQALVTGDPGGVQ